MDAGNQWTAVIIEDDPDVRDLIDIVLTQSGFKTVVAENGPLGVDAVRDHNPLITTLDVNMPGMDGFAVAKRLREFSSTYLIMITALADEIDVVQGFEAGADDYLVKPFRPRELRARADSMLRRPRARYDVPPSAPEEPPARAPEPEPSVDSWAAEAARDLETGEPALSPYGGAGKRRGAPEPRYPYLPPVDEQPLPPAPPEPAAQPVQQHAATPPPAPVRTEAPRSGSLAERMAVTSWLRLNGLALDRETRIVTLDGVTVELSQAEFDLLASLLETGRRVRSKADLVLTMRGQQYVTSYFVSEADKRSVEVNVANLRRKLGDEGPTARYIETVKGVGYRMAEAV
ncbi:response regulator transcription factor [Nocardioides dongkuii]|uniref:response regulator transcription factor n=1 Tax=Nocardioides dongkuii TaxID=2760089 RepID=UPI0015F867F9|nr:response regulator transcription factor [Nocardioides dongkuii]